MHVLGIILSLLLGMVESQAPTRFPTPPTPALPAVDDRTCILSTNPAGQCTVTAQLGCYDSFSGKDKVGIARSPFQVSDNDIMTPQLCAARCFNEGFTAPTDMAAVEYGLECYCGSGQSSTNPPSELKVADGECQANKCPGDVTQDCGGPYRCVGSEDVVSLVYGRSLCGDCFAHSFESSGLGCSSTAAPTSPWTSGTRRTSSNAPKALR